MSVGGGWVGGMESYVCLARAKRRQKRRCRVSFQQGGRAGGEVVCELCELCAVFLLLLLLHPLLSLHCNILWRFASILPTM